MEGVLADGAGLLFGFPYGDEVGGCLLAEVRLMDAPSRIEAREAMGPAEARDIAARHAACSRKRSLVLRRRGLTLKKKKVCE